MAAFTLTGVKAKTVAVPQTLTAAEAVGEGNAVTNLGEVVDPTDANKLAIIGVSIQDAASAGLIIYAPSGSKITVTNTLTLHRTLVCKPSGQVDYEENLAAGETHIIFGFSEDANTIVVLPYNSGQEKA